MNLRGVDFGTPISITEPLTLLGDAGKRMRTVAEFGGGVILSDGRACRESLEHALGSGTWQKQAEPFFLHVRLAAGTPDTRMEEAVTIATLVQEAKAGFAATFAVCIDLGGLPAEDAAAYKEEALNILRTFSSLGLPLVPMVSLMLAPDVAGDILNDSNADALLLADSVAWSDLPERARKIFFRTKDSPLKAIGGGKVSGKYLLPLAVEWVRQLRRQFVRKPVITGAGLLRPGDVDMLKEAGVSAVVIGRAVRRLRPWNMWRIVRRARKILN